MDKIKKRTQISRKILGITAIYLSIYMGIWVQPIVAVDKPTGARTVAHIFGVEIGYDEIMPNSEQLKEMKTRLTSDQYRSWIMDFQKKRVSSLILGPLFDLYVEENELQPEGAELQSFVYSMHQSRKKNLVDWRSEKKNAEQSLLNPAISAQERENLTATVDRLEQAIASMSEVEKRVEVDHENLLNMEKNLALEFVRNWKLNQSLYQRYGGRVIFQQAGPEPIDAYRVFLTNAEKQGQYKIYDENLRQLFWDYFVNDRKHNFYPENEAAKIFLKPWWLGVSR